MTSLYEPVPLVDWLDCEWSGCFSEEEEEEYSTALCGSWTCPGDCHVCVTVSAVMKQTFLPIYGPVNKDGVPMGYLLITG